MAGSSDLQDDVFSEGESEGSHRVVTALLRLASAIRSSFLVFVMISGVVLAVVGATPLLDGAGAGLAAVVGVSMILYGILGFVILRMIGYSG